MFLTFFGIHIPYVTYRKIQEKASNNFYCDFYIKIRALIREKSLKIKNDLKLLYSQCPIIVAIFSHLFDKNNI